MQREHLPFIDWMKAAGISLIVVGHVAGAPINGMVPPIYPKQLGVAFFMFVMGFSLARERRPGWQVLFNRLFEIYLFGIAIALIMSAIMYATRGTLNLSNYLPFFFGANVLFNNFPANPTTWYIGTYFHVLVLWAVVVRRLRVRPWMLLLSVALEVAMRAGLLLHAGEYVAYMAVPNWITVLLLGTWFGQRSVVSPDRNLLAQRRQAVGIGYVVLLAGVGVAGPLAIRPHIRDDSFPFMSLSSVGRPTDALITAGAVSIVYICYTLLVFGVAQRLTAPSAVQFLARNTIIVFIAHMPVFYALEPVVHDLGFSYLARSIVRIFACLIVLAVVSEIVRRILRPQVARAWLANGLARFFPTDFAHL